jgi:hypothetical protein
MIFIASYRNGSADDTFDLWLQIWRACIEGKNINGAIWHLVVVQNEQEITCRDWEDLFNFLIVEKSLVRNFLKVSSIIVSVIIELFIVAISNDNKYLVWREFDYTLCLDSIQTFRSSSYPDGQALLFIIDSDFPIWKRNLLLELLLGSQSFVKVRNTILSVSMI